MIELFLFKKLALQHLLGDWLSALDIKAHVKTAIRNACRDIATFRLHCGSPADSQTKSRSWQVGWARAEEATMEFIEAASLLQY